MTVHTSTISPDETRALLQAEEKVLSQYSVGFVLPVKSDDATLGGSGTFVTIDDSRGILTAAHVVEALSKHETVGLVLAIPGKPHRPQLSLSRCRTILLRPTEMPKDGPDLAFVVPPPDLLGALAAVGSFYNLTKRQPLMLESPPDINLGMWLLSGFADEWTGDLPPEPGFPKLKSFNGMHGLGKVAKEYEAGDFDYLVYEALYNDLYEGPNTYGGFSGGALWHLLGRPNENGSLEITERLLSGVAFYESGKEEVKEGTTRQITCQGRKSIYRNLISQVREVL